MPASGVLLNIALQSDVELVADTACSFSNYGLQTFVPIGSQQSERYCPLKLSGRFVQLLASSLTSIRTGFAAAGPASCVASSIPSTLGFI